MTPNSDFLRTVGEYGNGFSRWGSIGWGATGGYVDTHSVAGDPWFGGATGNYGDGAGEPKKGQVTPKGSPVPPSPVSALNMGLNPWGGAGDPDYGRLWEATGGYGRLWEAMGGY